MHRRHSEAGTRRSEVPRLRRGAHRAGPGVERDRLAAGHRHLDQRQRALRGRDRRHGQPRRHDADGPPPRRRHRGGRTGAVCRAARRRGAAPGGDGRHARSAQRLDQRRARALQVQPRHPRHHQRRARCLRRRRARRTRAHLRATRPALHARGDDARGGGAERRRLAAALGARGQPRSACRCTACPAAPATTR